MEDKMMPPQIIKPVGPRGRKSLRVLIYVFEYVKNISSNTTIIANDQDKQQKTNKKKKKKKGEKKKLTFE